MTRSFSSALTPPRNMSRDGWEILEQLVLARDFKGNDRSEKLHSFAQALLENDAFKGRSIYKLLLELSKNDKFCYADKQLSAILELLEKTPYNGDFLAAWAQAKHGKPPSPRLQFKQLTYRLYPTFEPTYPAGYEPKQTGLIGGQFLKDLMACSSLDNGSLNDLLTERGLPDMYDTINRIRAGQRYLRSKDYPELFPAMCEIFAERITRLPHCTFRTAVATNEKAEPEANSTASVNAKAAIPSLEERLNAIADRQKDSRLYDTGGENIGQWASKGKEGSGRHLGVNATRGHASGRSVGNRFGNY